MTEHEVIEKVIRRYASKCWWADIRDLRQEGWVALLEAKRRFEPQRGTPFSAFAWVCVTFAIRNYLWEQSAPVTGPKHRGRKLEGMQRESVAKIRHMPAPGDTTEAEAWWAQVRQIVSTAILDGHGGHFAAAVLLDGMHPADVAREVGLPATQIYRFTGAARRRIKADEAMRELLQDGLP